MHVLNGLMVVCSTGRASVNEQLGNVLIEVSVTRLIERREEPSTSIFRIAVRLESGSLLIS